LILYYFTITFLILYYIFPV